MKYKIVKETKPTLNTFGKYKAKAVHNGVVGNHQIMKEVAEYLKVSEGDVLGVMMGLSTVISRHLRRGDKVRLDSWGLMKLEIESEKVDRTFAASASTSCPRARRESPNSIRTLGSRNRNEGWR